MDRQKYDIQRIVYNIFLTKHDTIPYTPTGSASLHICCSVTANVLQRYCIYAAVTLHMCCSATAKLNAVVLQKACTCFAVAMHYPIALFGLSIILASSLCPSVGSLSNGRLMTQIILHWAEHQTAA